LIGGLIGGMIGGGGGGMFGPPPTVGPNANANLAAFKGIGAYVSSAGADNGGDASGARAMAQSIADAVNKFAKQLGTEVTNFPQFGVVNFASKGGLGFTMGGHNDPDKTFGSDASALQAYAALYILRNGGLGNLSGSAGTVVRNSQATSLEELQADIDFAKQYDALIADTGEKASEAADKMKALKDQFDGMKTKAGELGLSVSALDDAYSRAVTRMRDDYNKQIHESILQITDPLQYALDQLEEEHQAAIKDATALGADINQVEELYGLKRKQIIEGVNQATTASVASMAQQLKQMLDQLTVGPMSALSPGEQYSAARTQFEAAKTQATTAGTLPTDFADIVNRFLEASKTMYASSEGYAADYNLTTDLLRQLTGTGHAAGGFASGWTLVGERGPELVNLPMRSRVFSSGTMPANDNGNVVAAINMLMQPLGGIYDRLGEIRDLLQQAERRASRLAELAGPMGRRRSAA
jgi:gas vesicle protein